jgi:adenylate kinase
VGLGSIFYVSKIFLFMGIQGSGKGTQATRLSEALRIPQISTGDIFRAMMKQESPLGDELRGILNRGDLVPDELTSRMVRERIAQPDAQNGFILDGYPRTLPQAQHLDEMLKQRGEKINAVLFFDLPREKSVERLEPRRICTKDQTHIYHLKYNPPKNDMICDIDGAPLKQRDDDKPEAIRKRVDEYLAQTIPVIENYRKQHPGLVRTIDATRSIEEVRKQLDDIANE